MHISRSRRLKGGGGSGDPAVPSLRICFAANGRAGEYQELRVEFRDALMWRQAMGLAPRRPSSPEDNTPIPTTHQAGPDSCVKTPGDDKPPGPKRLCARTSRRFETLESNRCDVSRAKAPPIHRPIPGETGRDREAPASKEAMEIEDNRRLALDILEGRHVPAPNRSYTGSLTHTFQSMYQDEVRAQLGPLVSRHVVGRPGLLGLTGRRRGWALLHSIIASELRTGALRGVLPRPGAGRKAVLLLVEEQARGGDEIRVRGRRNLEACGAGELDDVLEGVQARGWRDVILVTASDGGAPLRLGSRREVRVLEWGRGMI